MENVEVERLNRRLGECLGRVRSGTIPRFSWQWAPELPFWASRIGFAWVLCEYRTPTMTEWEWKATVGSESPYQRNGMYCAYMETALPFGMEPTPELTQHYIKTISEQMDKNYSAHLRDGQSKIDRSMENDRIEWIERTQNDAPAYNNMTPGSRSGHVSFGGL